jgi:hypothetical protein
MWPPNKPTPESPRHPRRLALQLAVSCQSIAQAFELTGAEATQRWTKIAALLTQSGRDPHWRRRPSVLDQLRGWKRQPMTRKKTNGGEVNHGNFKAAASVDTYGTGGIEMTWGDRFTHELKGLPVQVKRCYIMWNQEPCLTFGRVSTPSALNSAVCEQSAQSNTTALHEGSGIPLVVIAFEDW